MIDVKCAECKEKIYGSDIADELAWNDWIWLLNSLEYLYLQGDISVEFYERACEKLLTFRPQPGGKVDG